MGRALQKLVGWKELHSMYGELWGEGLPKKGKWGIWEGDSLEEGKYLANMQLE